MNDHKTKSILFVFAVWGTLFGLILYEAYEKLNTFVSVTSQPIPGFDEIYNKNR